MRRAALAALIAVGALGCGDDAREPVAPPPPASGQGTASLEDWVGGSAGPRAADPHAGVPGAPAHGPAGTDPHAGVPGAPALGPAGGDPHAGVPGAPQLGELGHGGSGGPAEAPPGGAMVRGRVAETIPAAGYTYLRVETTDGEVWVAGLRPDAEVGATVEAVGMVMEGFRSNALDRTFDRLVLASTVRRVDAADAPSE